MGRLRIVLDVNVLVSGLIVAGKPRELIQRGMDRQFTLILSNPILEEFADVISRQKFARYVDKRDVKTYIEFLDQIACYADIRSRFRIIKEDPSDDIILWTAFDSKADYVVSGDKHLLEMGRYRGIEIVSVDDVLDLLGRKYIL